MSDDFSNNYYEGGKGHPLSGKSVDQVSNDDPFGCITACIGILLCCLALIAIIGATISEFRKPQQNNTNNEKTTQPSSMPK